MGRLVRFALLVSALTSTSAPGLAKSPPAPRGYKAISITAPYTASARAAAQAVIDASNGDFDWTKMEIGKVRAYPWFGRWTVDYLFLVQFNHLDYPQVCIAMQLEDGSYQSAGCEAYTSVTSVYRLDRGATKIPWFGVYRERTFVRYCWDGGRYIPRSQGEAEKRCI